MSVTFAQTVFFHTNFFAVLLAVYVKTSGEWLDEEIGNLGKTSWMFWPGSRIFDRDNFEKI